MKNHSFKTLQKSHQSGFSLIEVMVGLAIGLLASLVVMQTFSTFEGKKRTTTGTSDAQANGSIALYNLNREIQLTGYGFPITDGPLKSVGPLNGAAIPSVPGVGDNNSSLLCNVNNLPVTADHDNNAGTAAVPLTPISITDGGAGNDVITINYGNSEVGGLSREVTNVAGNSVSVNTLGCLLDDTVLIRKKIAANNCMTSRITSGLAGQPQPNATNLTVSITVDAANSISIQAGDRLTCIGRLRNVTFDVNNNQLRRTSVENGAVAQQEMVSNVVSLQAQYGISDAPSLNQVTRWVNATGAWAAPNITSTTCNAGAANRNCIKAVRIGVITRNPKIENTDVSTTCSSTEEAETTGVCAWPGDGTSPAPTITLAGANWQKYRYRSFDVLVPLRNMRYAGELLL
jgi:type IV pilus assembly protein PilW